MHLPRILVALTPAEKDDFFPGESFPELESLASSVRQVNPGELPGDQWPGVLAEFRPEIIVAAWKTPPLPADVKTITGDSLRYVCYLPGSVRKLVREELLREGLLVTNWGNSIARTVAECGLMMAIACLRRISYWNVHMHAGPAWRNSEDLTGSLFERRVGLHGFGVIARELVKLIQPFGVSISTYSPSVPDALLDEFGVCRCASLEELFSDNDVLIELAALTPKSRHMVKEAHLRMIPEGGVFVNIGRGAVVDEEALARVAAEGRIQVGLDVFGTEPLPADSPFRELANVLLLPHLSGPTSDRRQDAGTFGLYNIRRYIRGEPLQSLITADVYARAT
jgi:phosphoglycerate dehydrogenase-like enzyme